MNKPLLILAFLLLPITAANSIESIDLDRYQGKVVMLDFWASWCVPCRLSFPWMNEMHERYGKDGLIIIAVNLDKEKQDAAEFLAEYPAKFLIEYDPDASLAMEMGVEAMPSSFIYGRDGQPFDKHMGFRAAKQDEYEAAIRRALELE